ncbi:ribonuclease I [Acidovorax sp. A1169]|uniref:ribonuclease T2 family protein n=1 Tax=Acidovorax sp. A1169 TaxID=3059524 RepID=UPI002737A756|nr:ribonuclease I [Acidovorax sp. A1169]MDP4077674.1 ribonuclease I [Acidovorax sp. A1169]
MSNLSIKVFMMASITTLAPWTASASEHVQGAFVASRDCDAYLSFRRGTNPGAIKVSPGKKYEIREVNDKDRTWLRIEVPGVSDPLRWVASECGIARDVIPMGDNSAAGADLPQECSIAGKHDSYVLAVTWQPGFCEHVKYDGTKPECENMASGRLVVSNLTLHGLWPNRQQCGTRYGACGNSTPDLSEETVSYISPWMPNFFYERVFGTYEWKKHGTCSGMTSDTYFRRAVDSVKVVNESAAGRYITSNVGGKISKQEFEARLRSETGRALAPNAFTLRCTNKQLFEIHVRLPLEFKEGASLNDLLGPNLQSSAASDPRACMGDEILIEASGK